MNLYLPNDPQFHLFLFTKSPEMAANAVGSGVDAIIVDWENQGKKLRQENFDTQINFDTYDDLCRVREVMKVGKLICRINGFETFQTPIEVELAIKAGADEIFLPMVQNVEEVVATLEMIKGRCGLNILIETSSALQCLPGLAKLPLNRAYVGLNDLHIQQNSRNIFVPLMNGTIENIRKHFQIPVGAGGVTYPPNGQPIASKYLINEYARLGINFSFLRRTFLRDHQQYSMAFMVESIKKAYQEAAARMPQEIEADFGAFKNQVDSWTTNPHFI